ncbi:DUF1905 domain-containing protein [Mangrovimonas sp. DI 80]|uniref:DUF1905 domain-containing protein n=1 Tax=Mangrovimonas sp. DI 80 TaxID=1779330 RepID=UPI000977514B|nr:DUF1905 domain-containing protein [Mangrovimonas sp. DI 80]OMP32352.1 hypothetical protein BKM32_04685 [Mangrovimonas sp. DI 80]
MEGKITYQFTSRIWKHDAPGGWYFASLPKDISKEIRAQLKWQEQGWGRMTAVAIIDTYEWQTAIWFDTKLDTYLLPIKAEARKNAHIALDEEIVISIRV